VDGLDVAQLVVRVVFALAFIGMGVNHFRPGPRRIMGRMIPPFLRGKDPRTPDRLVLLTGVCEIAGGIGLLIPALWSVAAIALMIFLVAVFPANAFAAANRDRFGALAVPFWPRLIAQIVMIGLLAFTLLP
jgi:uncharacterized membrane protein